MKQLVELQAYKDRFESAGIGLVVITYDSETDQQAFVNRYDINFPMVSDIKTNTVRSLGILNEQVEEDSMAYGVPYPGFFVVDGFGTIRGRSFLEGYEKRLEASAVLAMADAALGD